MPHLEVRVGSAEQAQALHQALGDGKLRPGLGPVADSPEQAVVEKRPHDVGDLHQAVDVLASRGVRAVDVLHPEPVVFQDVQMIFRRVSLPSGTFDQQLHVAAIDAGDVADPRVPRFDPLAGLLLLDGRERQRTVLLP